ncbi:MAG: DUF397 domain-containing protein [Actinomadura sp.]
MSAPAWRKASYSGGSDNTDCVELARVGRAAIGVRDSKNPEGGHLSVSPDTLGHLLTRIKTGDLEL